MPKADITVDFGRTMAIDDAAAIGVDESSYGTPSDIHDPTAQQLPRKLGVGYARLWATLANPSDPSSRITCAAAGCDTGLNVDNWVQMMDATGEVPVAGIPDTLSAADAAAIVRHFTGFASGGAPSTTWIIGNEPESIDETVATYDARFNALYDAMKKADPAIKIGGPATLGFDRPFLTQFLADCGSRADFVDLHFYPGHETAAQLLAGLPVLSQDLGTLRGMIKTAQPARAGSIAIHVGASRPRATRRTRPFRCTRASACSPARACSRGSARTSCRPPRPFPAWTRSGYLGPDAGGAGWRSTGTGAGEGVVRTRSGSAGAVPTGDGQWPSAPAGRDRSFAPPMSARCPSR